MANPFTPGITVYDSDRFAGRDSLIIDALDYLINNRNIFIAGKRGVGKSSFAYQIKYLLEGNPAAYNRFSLNDDIIDQNVFILSHRCSKEDTLEKILNSIMNELNKLISAENYTDIQEKTKTIFKLSFLSREYEKAHTKLPQSLISLFSNSMIDFLNKNSFLQEARLVIFIDEIDIILTKINLAEFIKLFQENISYSGYRNINFILIGISDSLNTLKKQHASITRYVVPIYVPTMGEKELREIIERCLKDTLIKFDPDIVNNIVKLSQGFPDPVHVFGYEMYKICNLKKAKGDFETFHTVLKKVATELKKEEYVRFLNDLPSLKHEKVLSSMAMTSLNDEYVSINTLCKKTEMSEEECFTILKELCTLEFTEKGKLGYYRFIDPIFRVYLRIMILNKEYQLERTKYILSMKTLQKGTVKPNKMYYTSESEKQLFELIIKNYFETGRSGFWG